MNSNQNMISSNIMNVSRIYQLGLLHFLGSKPVKRNEECGFVEETPMHLQGSIALFQQLHRVVLH